MCKSQNYLKRIEIILKNSFVSVSVDADVNLAAHPSAWAVME